MNWCKPPNFWTHQLFNWPDVFQELHYWRSHCGSFWALRRASDISTWWVQSLVVMFVDFFWPPVKEPCFDKDGGCFLTFHHLAAGVWQTSSTTRISYMFKYFRASPFFENQQAFLYVRATPQKTYISQKRKSLVGSDDFFLLKWSPFFGETFPFN